MLETLIENIDFLTTVDSIAGGKVFKYIRMDDMDVGTYITKKTVGYGDITPDYSTTIFSTMGSSVSVMHKSGVLTPVRTTDKFCTHTDKADLCERLGVKDVDGILVVEKFYITPTQNFKNTQSIINYYLASDNIEFGDDIKALTRMKMKSAINNRNTFSAFDIVITTFIAKSSIKENTYSYLPSSDLMLVYGELHDDIKHPGSVSYKEALRDNIDDFKDDRNIITIDIVSDDITIPYYTRVGKKSHKLFTVANKERPNCCTIKTYRNNIEVDKDVVELGDLKDIGIYRSEEDCDTDGNPLLAFEKEKLILDKEKLQYAHNELTSKTEKLSIEKEMLESKYASEKEKSSKDIESLQLKFDTETIKYKKELETIEAKAKSDKIKLRADKVKLKSDKEKYALELEALTSRFQHEIVIAEFKERLLSMDINSKIQDRVIELYVKLAEVRREKNKNIVEGVVRREKFGMDIHKHNMEMDMVAHKHTVSIDKIKTEQTFKLVDNAIGIVKTVLK